MATRSVVPRAAHEGEVGTIGKPWAGVRADQLQSLCVANRYTAASALSGQRVVVLGSGGLEYADANTAAHAGAVLGFTAGAISGGAEGDVIQRGMVEEGSWTWTPLQPIYLRNTGQVSGTPPTSGFVCMVGFALTATAIFVAIQQPITLA